MSKPKCIVDRNEDSITIYRPDRNEVMFTTYREDYWYEITTQTWRLDKAGYPVCQKLGFLHRYIMGKWYGEEVLEDLTRKGYVVDHLDNEHNNCRIDNLEFLLKDFNTGCYQITIGMNDPMFFKDISGMEHCAAAVKFLYTEDYPIVIKDAEMMLLHLERNEFNPTKYNACSARIYECLETELTEEEKNSAVVNKNGLLCIVLGTGCAYFNKVAPDRNWNPPENNKCQYQIYKPIGNI